MDPMDAINEEIYAPKGILARIEELEKKQEQSIKHLGDTRDICGKLEEKLVIQDGYQTNTQKALRHASELFHSLTELIDLNWRDIKQLEGKDPKEIERLGKLMTDGWNTVDLEPK